MQTTTAKSSVRTRSLSVLDVSERLLGSVTVPVLALFFFFVLILPTSIMLGSAFQTINMMNFQVVDRFTLHQFYRFFGDSFYLGILWDTIELSLATTLITLIIGYPYAYYMWNASESERRILRIISVSPLLISFVIMNFGWVIILSPGGIVNQTLQFLNITNRPLSMLHTKGTVILGLSQVYVPFMILSIENALNTIRPDVLKAGSSLGASRLRLFSNVVLPLSINGIVSGCVIVFAMTASSFVTPMLLGGAWVKTLATLAYQQVLVTMDRPFGSAISIILLLVTALFSALLIGAGAWLQPHRRKRRASTSVAK